MSISEQEWQSEQQRVDQVMKRINQRLDVMQDEVIAGRATIAESRKHFWDDVRLNLDNVEEAFETSLSLKQQSDVLSERERLLQHEEKVYQKLRRLQDTPYFGRIDFLEKGDRSAEQIYIGVSSFLDEENDTFLVYDWRAPVSSLYYDYGTGPAEFVAPSGTIAGAVELKRQFRIRNGRIRNLFDTGVTIGDELLQEALSNQSDAQMKSIVATIQREQNRIIRNELSRLLIVQGAAGSGKTSAALQRVAYLLYRYRDTLTSEQIVLFSPNPMFNSYVSTVLPELGEQNMVQTTFQEYLEHRLGRSFQLEDPFQQMEYTLTAMHEPGYETRMAGIRFKASLPFMKGIERYVAQLGQDGLLFRDVKFRNEVYLSGDEIRAQFYALPTSQPIPIRMKLLRKSLLKQVEEMAVLERAKPWVEEEIELLGDEVYFRVHQQLKRERQHDAFDYYERERELLAERVVNVHYKKLRAHIKRLRFLDLPAMYRGFFAHGAFEASYAEEFAQELPPEWEAICAQTVERVDSGELAYEDATPFLDLKERIEGFETNELIQHVIVDEAQDYSPFQMAFLKRLFPVARMTVLGDANQAIYAHTNSGSDGFTALAELFGAEETETILLTRSYRSTRPIIEMTSRLIAGGDRIEAFQREGRLPTITQVFDTAELIEEITVRVRELQDAGHQSIGIICKTAQESRQAYEWLSERLPLRLISKETSSFEQGVLVIPSYLAKGVEFDAVILFNASDTVYGRESERKLFYTACTRAMHELHVYSLGERTSFLKGIDMNARGISTLYESSSNEQS